MNMSKFGLYFFKKSLIFISLFLFGSNVFCGTIKGVVRDAKTQETLPGATVRIKGTDKGVLCDMDGNYELEIPAGIYTMVVSSMSYEPMETTNIKVGDEALVLDISLEEIVSELDNIVVVARANRENENALLAVQRDALLATQAVGARELSRKGIGDAQAAVAQVSGISRQEGVKNVFVRGLGDRYNATLLNGFPIPSEDPEYKNIALEFFSTDVISNIGVNKVFSAGDYSDVGGAVINISSKELVGNSAFGFDLSGGINTAAIGTSDFLRQDGSNYFGFANTQQPSNNKFDFPNSLDPSTVSFLVNHGFGVSGGKLFKIGENKNPLSFFIVASHSIDYSYTKETVRNATTAGTIFQDQTGEKYSQNTNQLVLANAMYDINKKHHLQYNFMLIHANEQYVGDYKGRNVYSYEQPGYMGILRRQQTNDNLLLVNQLSSNWELAKRWKLDAGVSYNTVKGNEPDRRENNFSQMPSGNYIFTLGDNQSRFYSKLTDNDFNVKAALSFKLNDRYKSDNSVLKIGYNGRFADNNFEGIRYSLYQSREEFNLDELKMDEWYNAANQTDKGRGELVGKEFIMETPRTPDSYQVTRSVHSGYAEASYQVLRNLTGNIGLRIDAVDMAIDYNVNQGGEYGEQSDKQNFLLPSFNLKYDVTKTNSLRLGASKTYTLPQAKEISPYQYVNISFTSQGNPNLKSSENYNVDLKWDYYISASELLSFTAFYKHILDPIGRVDEGNSAGMLTYNNISDKATVGGVEMEVRKNIFNQFNTALEETNRFSVGLNASYIYTNLKLDISGTKPRNSGLEGASPFLANVDISYNYTKKDRNLVATLVFNYFSNRIHTLGAMGYKDIIEKGVPTLDFSASYKFNKHFTLKAKASNLLNASYRLVRESSSGENITLNEFKKGQHISLGINYEL
ncbi:MAG: TonB-dependent receptor [Prevotellaceae bacterium]|jgi:TonB-dependent receptor|nr:TonB-dependent receptor [Prevotellaceae bacterium]